MSILEETQLVCRGLRPVSGKGLLWWLKVSPAARTWREVDKEDCQARKLNYEDATDRSKWRKLIKDVR